MEEQISKIGFSYSFHLGATKKQHIVDVFFTSLRLPKGANIEAPDPVQLVRPKDIQHLTTTVPKAKAKATAKGTTPNVVPGGKPTGKAGDKRVKHLTT